MYSFIYYQYLKMLKIIRQSNLIKLRTITTVPIRESTAELPNDPIICDTRSIRAEVVQGKKYLWCACGRSKQQPWCDGSHKATTIRPVHWTAPKTGIISLCNCKHTLRRPFCDGAHNHLPSSSIDKAKTVS